MVDKGDAVKKLEEELTCSVCLDRFTNPKILPCFHSFCLQCLQGIATSTAEASRTMESDSSISISCPKCRSPCELPRGGVSVLPSSFVVNNLEEVYSLLKRVSGSKDTNCGKCGKESSSNRYCWQCALFLCSECLQQHDRWITDHQTAGLDDLASSANPIPRARPSDCTDHNKPQEIFCETCDQLVCHLCTVRKHAGHNYDVVADVYSKYKRLFESNLELLNQQTDRLKEETMGIVEKGKGITKSGEKVKEKIHLVITDIKERLDNVERQVIEDVDLALEHKNSVTEQQVKDAEILLSQLTECRERVQQSLLIGTPHQILSSKPQIFSRMNSLLSEIKGMKFQPVEEADIELVLAENLSIDKICEDLATVKYTCHPAKVEIVSSEESVTLVAGEESTVTIAFTALNGHSVPVCSAHIDCRLAAPTVNHGSRSMIRPIPCPVQESATPSIGQYEILVAPATHGLHQLHVKVNGIEVTGSPLEIAVCVSPEKRSNEVKTIGGLGGPAGIALADNGLIIVSESSRPAITIMNTMGEKVISFGSFGQGKGYLRFPKGIAISKNGTILVADSGNHRIQEFSTEGKCLSFVGLKGKGPLEFRKPYGIAVNKTTGRVYVCDKNNNRLQILNPDLKFYHSFGSEGSAHGQFKEPYDVTLDSEEFVYVADYGNDRIQKFTAEGHFVSSFGTKGSALGQLTRPIGISVDKKYLYVSEDINNRRISVFTTDGKFVRMFGKGRPYRSTFDKNGYFYVCDDSENTIKVY